LGFPVKIFPSSNSMIIGNSPFIVNFPMKNGGSFHSYVNVYQRLPSLDFWPLSSCDEPDGIWHSKNALRFGLSEPKGERCYSWLGALEVHVMGSYVHQILSYVMSYI
jgi:hypothetical protein